MLRIIEDEELRHLPAEIGEQYAAMFTGKNTALQMIRACEEAHGG